jgi:hypothetical protein
MAEVHQGSEEILAVVWEELRFALRIVVCAFYISWWRLKRYLWTDSKLRKSASVIAVLASCTLLFEILLTLFHKEAAAWLGKSAILVLVPAAAVLIVHRVGEFRSKRKEVSFATRVRALVDAVFELGRQVNAAPAQKQARLDSFVQALLTQLCGDLGTDESKRPVTASIMMLDDKEEALRIVYLFPVGTKYDPDIRFKLGEGAAGFCFQKSRTVYIPSIRYMHGIVISEVAGEVEYGLMRRLYVPIAEEYEIYESILCLPVTCSRGSTHAVLNVDSAYPDAFNVQDVDVLRAYARMLGDAISLYM